MVSPTEVSAVLVTRGDVSLGQVLANYELFGLPYFVWANNEREDLSVYGRYAAIAHVDADVILVQDDDCVLPQESIEALLAAYQPGHVVCNMPERFREHYPDSALVGFGAVFDRDLPQRAFDEFYNVVVNRSLGLSAAFAEPGHAYQEWYRRTCDVVFTTLTPRILVDVPVQILDYAHGEDRMWKQPTHVAERQRMLALARQVRDAVTA